MENRRRVSLLLALLLEVSGLVFVSFVFSSDSFFTQELQLKSNITLCVGNATCLGEITLGLFSGWKAIDSGLGIKGREQYFKAVYSNKAWEPALLLWGLSLVCFGLSALCALAAITLSVINIALIPIETRHGPKAIWILNLVTGTGLNVAVACYVAMTFLLLPQGYYLSQVEIDRGWQGVSITTHLEIWLSILTSLPFYTATLITWLMVEKECSPKCSQQPKTFRTNDNFESSEMILY